MVLIINSNIVHQSKCPKDITSFYKEFPTYREYASAFLKVAKEIVGPLGLLYVFQREFGATTSSDKYVEIIGSEDATTCIIIIVQHLKSGAVALAHLDGSDTAAGIFAIIQRVLELSMEFPNDGITLQMFGGYSDSSGYSADLFEDILVNFHKHPIQVHIGVVCVGEMNTVHTDGTNWPIVYGVGVHVKTGRVFPASFPEKGPDKNLRQARIFGGSSEILDIYNSTSGQVQIGPFSYRLLNVDQWLRQDDKFLLQNMSTSPDVEPFDYVSTIRDTLRYIKANPYPSITIFPNNKPHCYKMENATGRWKIDDF